MKSCNFKKIGHLLCTENKIVKNLMNAFLNCHQIYKDFRQFRQILFFVDLFMTCNFKFYFKPFKSIFCKL